MVTQIETCMKCEYNAEDCIRDFLMIPWHLWIHANQVPPTYIYKKKTCEMQINSKKQNQKTVAIDFYFVFFFHSLFVQEGLQVLATQALPDNEDTEQVWLWMVSNCLTSFSNMVMLLLLLRTVLGKLPPPPKNFNLTPVTTTYSGERSSDCAEQ